ncbi:L,D-transpeptidase [Legionella parisiensis]|nr:L,D-transpeptidase [Legionella parisiensis]KTD41139.1 enhanced entry protein EnhA [Legionella parisiensis]STX76562.1 enhanced entry protein EnhA [Legionella parisiensis]
MEKQSSILSLVYSLFILLSFFLFSSPTLANTFVFNPNTLTWKAIDSNGKVVRTGKGSGGKRYCADIHRGCKTPSGVFTIWSKGGPGCKSSRYPVGKGGSPMPYCMFFSKYYAIHGSYDVPNYNASHGCVRVRPGDAKWLSKNFIRIGTKVIIKPY